MKRRTFSADGSGSANSVVPQLGRVLLATLSAFGFAHSAVAASLQPIEFSEAVHNLGYIDLYVAEHAKLFEKHGLTIHLTAAGGDTQAFAAVLGKTAQFAVGDPTMVEMSGRWCSAHITLAYRRPWRPSPIPRLSRG
jgi:NitT/TauT family transport system substrate-binding protein